MGKELVFRCFFCSVIRFSLHTLSLEQCPILEIEQIHTEFVLRGISPNISKANDSQKAMNLARPKRNCLRKLPALAHSRNTLQIYIYIYIGTQRLWQHRVLQPAMHKIWPIHGAISRYIHICCRARLLALVAWAIRKAIRANRFARIDSREPFAIETPIFIVREADSHESLEFPIRANHPIRANRANRFARITPLSFWPSLALLLEQVFRHQLCLFCQGLHLAKIPAPQHMCLSIELEPLRGRRPVEILERVGLESSPRVGTPSGGIRENGSS